MLPSASWRVLQSRADSNEAVNEKDVILAADYPATGRAAAGFGDLTAMLVPARKLWETMPPGLGTELGMTIDDHIERWMSDVRVSDIQVSSVLGYCVGGVFAAGLAESIAQLQGVVPRVILFDPERPHKALLYRHFGDAIGVISAYMSAAEISDAHRVGEQALQQSSGLDGLADTLSRLLSDLGGPVFERVGLDARRRTELVGTFSSFLRYLVAAAEFDPAKIWVNATAISSMTPHNGLNSLPAEERVGLVKREITFSVDHVELLRTQDVARTVQELLK